MMINHQYAYFNKSITLDILVKSLLFQYVINFHKQKHNISNMGGTTISYFLWLPSHKINVNTQTLEKSWWNWH